MAADAGLDLAGVAKGPSSWPLVVPLWATVLRKNGDFIRTLTIGRVAALCAAPFQLMAICEQSAGNRRSHRSVPCLTSGDVTDPAHSSRIPDVLRRRMRFLNGTGFSGVSAAFRPPPGAPLDIFLGFGILLGRAGDSGSDGSGGSARKFRPRRAVENRVLGVGKPKDVPT